jgi:hypothetical protein
MWNTVELNSFPFCGLIYDVPSISDHIASNGRMTDKLEKDLEGSGHGIIEILYFLELPEKTTKYLNQHSRC